MDEKNELTAVRACRLGWDECARRCTGEPGGCDVFEVGLASDGLVNKTTRKVVDGAVELTIEGVEPERWTWAWACAELRRHNDAHRAQSGQQTPSAYAWAPQRLDDRRWCAGYCKDHAQGRADAIEAARCADTPAADAPVEAAATGWGYSLDGHRWQGSQHGRPGWTKAQAIAAAEAELVVVSDDWAIAPIRTIDVGDFGPSADVALDDAWERIMDEVHGDAEPLDVGAEAEADLSRRLGAAWRGWVRAHGVSSPVFLVDGDRIEHIRGDR